MKLYLFDDGVADGWEPFAISRPVGELMYGALGLRSRLERAAGVQASISFARPWLVGFREAGAPPVNARGDVAKCPLDEDRLFLLTRLCPSDDAEIRLEGGETRTLVTEGEIVGCFLPAGTAGPDPDWLENPEELPGSRVTHVGGEVLSAVWQLLSGHLGRLRTDLEELVVPGGDAASSETTPAHAWLRGDGLLQVCEDVRIEPGAFFDTSGGPIYLDRGVEVRTGVRLAGPTYVGPSSRLLGGSISGLAAGPCSVLSGEIEASVFLGYANKAHDGFIGHAYVGRWVNLGALSTNSDLKNNYGPIRLGGPAGPDTGLTKLGCLLGDHVKTAIGTLLSTGSVVGAGCNVFGDGQPPACIQPFSWGFGEHADVFARQRFLETAGRVMARRGLKPDPDLLEGLGQVWDAAAARHDTGSAA